MLLAGIKKWFSIFVLVLLVSCVDNKPDEIYNTFVIPPSETRPFIRWWWHGNKVEVKTIIRELELLKEAGIGGVEINSVSFPEEADDTGVKTIKQYSKEWEKILKITCESAENRGLFVDINPGSGWPMPAKDFVPDKIISRIVTNYVDVEGPILFHSKISNLENRIPPGYNNSEFEELFDKKLEFIKLIPYSIENNTQIIDLTEAIDEIGGNFMYRIPPGKHRLIIGIRQWGYMKMQNAVPSMQGFAANYLTDNYIKDFLNTFIKTENALETYSRKCFRAVYCDSIHRAGINWPEDFPDFFSKKTGYNIEPYLPFLIYSPKNGYQDFKFENKAFADSIRRVRYDYNKTLKELYYLKIINEYRKFAEIHDLAFRYTANKYPYHTVVFNELMTPEIPEGTANLVTDLPSLPNALLWNKFAASNAHITGMPLASCIAMINSENIFSTRLKELKRADDMNFISGINHTILHGYNYSPADAGFPGWIGHGTYFSEQNSWWSYLKYWTAYNSRLSSVFQQTNPIVQIAILAPVNDNLSTAGYSKKLYYRKNTYCYEMWKAISQNGASADYIDEPTIQKAQNENGTIRIGKSAYNILILADVESLEPFTAQKIAAFVKSGGKIVCINKKPHRSLSYKSVTKNDSIVKSYINHIFNNYPDNVFTVEQPKTNEPLISWIQTVFKKTKITPDVEIINPCASLYQVHYSKDNRDFFFFVNNSDMQTINYKAVFPMQGKTPWRWYPETGRRLPYCNNYNTDTLLISLEPLESILLVLDTKLRGKYNEKKINRDEFKELSQNWKIEFQHINKNKFTRKANRLFNFIESPDSLVNTFSGTVTYSTTIKMENDNYAFLDLGSVYGITEVILNSEKLGACWWGNHIYKTGDILKPGENTLKIILTTTLTNYIQTLSDDPTIKKWSSINKKEAAGLIGPVKFYSAE